ncbi:hypothetical protein AAZX31_12G045500 [Glycine max]|uniref:Uncharacterized protein n=1 Tax=Glycine max TaxID=3847 RepID=K7LT22_SOYBN|nr:uncharacterized protein LOC102668110 [Glycine max]KAH1141637.1 hypothetical protein GYH30_032720 [Glycine max]KAH1220180.1 hypothetical protein GmHk_12G033908 [Glycine max]KRH24541.1 hypothetical protein GLYMA_12G047600v4 [Glycine max]|eukprot:XP_006592121.1 uncharacterized protein LOC102668110 [Glycine max]
MISKSNSSNMQFHTTLCRRSSPSIYEGLSSAGTGILDEAERVGMKRVTTLCVHVIVQRAGWVSEPVSDFDKVAGEGLHKQLAEEIRSVVAACSWGPLFSAKLECSSVMD